MGEDARDGRAHPRAAVLPGPVRRRTGRLLLRRAGLLLAVLALAGGCGGAAPVAAPQDPEVADPLTDEQAELNDLLDQGGAIERLPACGAPPPEVRGKRPAGLELPPGSVLQLVEPGEPLVTVHGFVELTPVLVRRYYEQRGGLTVYDVEDEGFESELLVGNGEARTYVKALATCQTGSTLLAVVGPEGAGGLPVPAGSPSAPPAG